MKKIVLVRAQEPQCYTEPGTDVIWVRDSYTEPRESLVECCNCQHDIEDWELWTCMDGGEGAHLDCVRVRDLTVAERTVLARRRVCPRCHAEATKPCKRPVPMFRASRMPGKPMKGVHAERLALIGRPW